MISQSVKHGFSKLYRSDKKKLIVARDLTSYDVIISMKIYFELTYYELMLNHIFILEDNLKIEFYVRPCGECFIANMTTLFDIYHRTSRPV